MLSKYEKSDPSDKRFIIENYTNNTYDKKE